MGKSEVVLTSVKVQRQVSGTAAANSTLYAWTAPTRPHIVLALADDLGWADVGWHEYAEANLESATPFLDTLVPESTRLERMYTAPICSPSRAQLWTGRYFYRYGHGPAVTSGGFYGLSGRETTLAEILKGNGYHTAILGKWHLGYQDERFWPTFRGFDNHVGPFSLDWTSRSKTKSFRAKFLAQELEQESLPGLATLHNASIKDEQLSFADELPPLLDLETSNAAYEDMHNVDILKHESRRYVHTYFATEARHKPLFLNVAFRSPHTPIEAPARYGQEVALRRLFGGTPLTTYRRGYLQMVHAMDAAIEETVQALIDEYAWDDTLFIFTSDNGGLDTKFGGASNWPLMGSKNAVWEGGIRVASLIRGTASPLARLDASVRGGTNDVYMHFVDLLPTIATGIAGIPVAAYKQAWKCARCLAHNDNKLDGMDRWETIRTGVSNRGPELRVLSVITEEQAELVENPAAMASFIPRPWWDSEFYRNTSFAPLMNMNYTINWGHARTRASVHGGGAVQYGPYKLAWGKGRIYDRLREEPWHLITTHLRADLFRRTRFNFPIRSPIDYGGLPRGHDDLVFLFNVDDDPNEEVNLFRRGRLTPKIQAIVRAMADLYKKTQQPEEAITDNYLRYAISFDPAELVEGLKTQRFFQPFCNSSLRCIYDTPVIRDFEAPTAAPTAAPTLFPTRKPTTASPTQAPTLFPTRAPTTASPTRSPNTRETDIDFPTSVPTPAPMVTYREFIQSLGKRFAMRMPVSAAFPRGCRGFRLRDREISSTPFLTTSVPRRGQSWIRACWNLCVAESSQGCRGYSVSEISRKAYTCNLYDTELDVDVPEMRQTTIGNLVLDPRTCGL